MTTSQHQSQANAPVHSKKSSTTANRMPPTPTASARPLSMSVTNVPGVVRLKPYRASITKVEYRRKGRPRTDEASPSDPMYKRPVKTGPYPNVRIRWSTHSNPPACHHARMIKRLTVLCTSPNLVRVWVYFWL